MHCSENPPRPAPSPFPKVDFGFPLERAGAELGFVWPIKSRPNIDQFEVLANVAGRMNNMDHVVGVSH